MTRAVSHPKIVRKQETKVSPWVDLVEKDIEFSPARPADIYHSVGLSDYVAMLAG